MISPKYSISIILLTTLALVPVTIHTYLGLTASDGRSVRNIKTKLLSFYSSPTGRKPERIKKKLAAEDWIERSYITDSGRKIILFAARSFDYKKLYHHPEIALIGSLKISDSSLKIVPALEDLPVHIIADRSGRQNGLIAYSLLVDNTFVVNPYIYQLTNSWKSLFQFTRPMTLFFVFDSSYSPADPAEESEAVRLLNEAIVDFRAL